MAETPDEILQKLAPLLQTGFRGRLTSRGAARALVWRSGVLPADGPQMAETLTQELLSYGFGLLRIALKARTFNIQEDSVSRSFEIAAEAIESVVRNGDPQDISRGFCRVVAAASYHLGKFSARAYSLITQASDDDNLSTIEKALSLLILRNLNELYHLILSELSSTENLDERIIERLENPDDEYSSDDALVAATTDNYLRSLASFFFALRANEEAALYAAQQRLADGEELCFQAGFVAMWWIYRLTKFLINDLWEASIQRLLPTDAGDNSNWPRLRNLFVASLAARNIAELDLWPSQVGIAKRVADTQDNIIASLPTSAGKTRIAELCILRALSSGHRVIFITPLRALSAQTERTLRRTFGRLGFDVSSLYGAAGTSSFDLDSLATQHIVVSTPEKLDFALRNNSNLLEDVSLIVLDEGHMLGPTEREVRYEVLIQRLLRRPDAHTRRIVCLSAMLPSGEDMDDFVSWLRNDRPGGPLTSSWRPTRQRFGHILWNGSTAKYELTIGEEQTFIQGFVKLQTKYGPKGGAKFFPDGQNDLVLAAAWRLAKEKLAVLIYCPERRSVNAVAKRLLKAHAYGFLEPLEHFDLESVKRACSAGKEWLGPDHPALKCLELGVAVHHAAFPKPYLKMLDVLIAAKHIPIIIASPTLARGLNISATSVLFQSIFRFDVSQGQRVPISIEEFSNVAGRAGRAYVDLDGQVIGVCDSHEQLTSWHSLVSQEKQRTLESGLLSVIRPLLRHITNKVGKNKAAVEYVVNNSSLWTKPPQGEDKLKEWNHAIEILDVALLSLFGEDDCTLENVALILDKALSSSFLRRRLKRKTELFQELFSAILDARAKHICSTTSTKQRRSYFFSGVGLTTGQFLDKHATELNAFLMRAEESLSANHVQHFVSAVLQIAEVVFQISPFAPNVLPVSWQLITKGWLTGLPMVDLEALSRDASSFVEDGLVYRLAWAVEAIRVRSRAQEENLFEDKPSKVAAAIEAGTTSMAEATLIQAGLNSRIAASKALRDYPAKFSSRSKMLEWLTSDDLLKASHEPSWPTEDTRDGWLDFMRAQSSKGERQWGNYDYMIEASFANKSKPPSPGTPVFLWETETGMKVFTPDMIEIGECRTQIEGMPLSSAIGRVADSKRVEIHYVGPVPT